jgi:predicted nucleic acid-binding protein
MSKINFHDALMVLAAREMGISHIVSFDQDFDDVEEIDRISRP